MTLLPDYSLLLQIIVFVALWQGLRRLLFDPVADILDRRDARTTGALATATSIRASAAGARAQYDDAFREARQRLTQESEADRKAVQADATANLAAARDRTAAQVAQARQQLAAQVDAARTQLSAQARTLADEMLDRISGNALS
jgi:F-type H+-transporting ATPase subunit b